MSDSPAPILVRPQRLLRDGLIASYERHPHKQAVVVSGASFTYSDLFDASSRLAAALVERGIQRGDRVAIYMDNTWPCIVSIYAVLLAGGVFLTINPQTKKDKLEYILNNSEANILLSEVSLEKNFIEAIANTPNLKNTIVSGDKNIENEVNNITLESFDDVIHMSLGIDPAWDGHPQQL